MLTIIAALGVLGIYAAPFLVLYEMWKCEKEAAKEREAMEERRKYWAERERKLREGA